MAAPNPWDPASAPSAAGLLLNHWVASGIVTEVCWGGDGVIKGATEFRCEVVVVAARVGVSPLRAVFNARQRPLEAAASIPPPWVP